MDLTRLFGALVFLCSAVLVFKTLRVSGPSVDGDVTATTTTVGRSRRDSALRRSLDRKVRSAGMSGVWSPDKLMVTKMVGAAVGAGLGLLLIVANPSRLAVLAFLIFTAAGFFGVDVILSRRADAHKKAVERSLPDVLDQLTICVGAGLGFDAAMARVAATNKDDALGQELGRVLRDERVGMTRSEALMAMSDRVELNELRTVVRAIVQSSRAGVPVGRVLRVQAEEVRERRRVRAEERAMKMPVKLVFPLVLCVLPALFVVVLGPAILRLSQMNLTGG